MSNPLSLSDGVRDDRTNELTFMPAKQSSRRASLDRQQE
jgi:hypothetical protein